MDRVDTDVAILAIPMGFILTHEWDVQEGSLLEAANISLLEYYCVSMSNRLNLFSIGLYPY